MTIQQAQHRDVDVRLLVERERNPNRMPAEQFALLVAAIKQIGQCLQPVLVRERADGVLEIVDGAHRVRASKEAGLETVPAVIVKTDEEVAAALQLGMNRMRGEVDLADAAAELERLFATGWSDFSMAGFAAEDAISLVASLREENPDDVLAGADMSQPEDVLEPKRGELALEITGFETASELRKVKRFLRKAGGGDLRRGLLKTIGEEGTHGR